MTTPEINWADPFEIPRTAQHDGYSRLVMNGQPVTDAIHSPKGQPLFLQMGVPVDTPQPPPSEWPEFAWTPDGHEDTIEVNDNLADALSVMGGDNNLVVLHERCIPQLAEIAETDPELLSTHNFTARPDEFHQHTLSFNSGKHFDFPGFQGFRITNPGGIGLRLTGTGKLSLCCNEIVKCGQGIAVTGENADMNIFSRNNRYDEFIEFGDGHPQAVYINRGYFLSEEDVITQVGHLRGDPRKKGSVFNHAFYVQPGGRLVILNTFIADMDNHGVNCRGNCDIDGLVVVRASNGVGIGHDKDLPPVTGTINRSIIANMEDLDDRKTGIGIAAEKASVTVSNSVIADERSAGDGSAFRLYDKSSVTLGSDVRTQGLPRIFDVSGSDTRASGFVGTTDAGSQLVNVRPSASNHSGNVTRLIHEPVTLPDFDRITAPRPGYVGALIESVLNA